MGLWVSVIWIMLLMQYMGTIGKHIILPEDHDFGTAEGNGSMAEVGAKPYRVGKCYRRKKDSKIACTPDVMFIGASKAGTSSLAEYLFAHPLIYNTFNTKGGSNEGHFFDWADKRGIKLSESPAEMANLRSGILQGQIGFAPSQVNTRPLVMEYTPNYLVVDDLPSIVRGTFPKNESAHMKFVVMLRDPVKRTRSSWLAKKSKDEDNKLNSFAEAVAVGKRQGLCIARCFDRPWEMRNGCSMERCRRKYDSTGFEGAFGMLAHVVKSMYSYQIMNWFHHFPKRNFFFLTLEQYVANPIGTYQKVLRFLGLPLYDPKGVKGFKDRDALVNVLRRVKNVAAKYPDLEAEMTLELSTELEVFFHPNNALTDKLVGFKTGYPTYVKNETRLREILSPDKYARVRASVTYHTSPPLVTLRENGTMARLHHSSPRARKGHITKNNVASVKSRIPNPGEEEDRQVE